MATLDSLLVQIDASTELLRRELAKGGAAVDNFSRNTDKRLGGFGATLKNMGTQLRSALGVFGTGFAVTAVANFTRNAIQAADAIGETARAAGMGAERFQRLSYVFQNNGVDATEFESAMKALNTRLGQFITTGGGPAKTALDRLGLSQRVLNGEIRTSEQLFDAVVANFGKLGTAAEQGAVAAALFGKNAGPLMRDTLSQGTEAMKAAEAAARGLFSDEQVRQADLLNDAFKRISATIGTTLKGAIIETTADLAEMFGIIDLGVKGELQDLDNLIRNLEAADQAGALGGNRKLLEDARARREQLSQEANRPGFRTGETMDQEIARRKAEAMGELEEIKVSDAGVMQRFDFAGVAKGIAQGDPDLKELSANVAKMPADLQKLSPAFNDAVVANQKYIETLKETSKQHSEVFQALGHGLQSALANAFRGISTNFRDMLKDMAADLAASALVKGLGSLFSGSTGKLGEFFSGLFSGARAKGGPVQAGRAYLVGEDGPEPFIPGMSGTVLPNAALAGGGGVVYNDYSSFTVQGGGDPRQVEAAMRPVLAQHKREVMAEIKDKQRRGRF